MIEVREWDMRSLDAGKLFKKSRVKKLPSIAVNGELVFESRIPDQDELIDLSNAATYKVRPWNRKY